MFVQTQSKISNYNSTLNKFRNESKIKTGLIAGYILYVYLQPTYKDIY